MRNAHPRPWHRQSLFGDGPRRTLDREQRARFTFLLHAHRGVGRVSAATEDVGLALIKRLSVDGRCDPSHATLGTDAGCHERTARRATARLRKLGLLLWQQRLVRNGWRTEQTSNAYVLLTPAINPPPRCGGQMVRETGRKNFKSANQPSEGSDAWGRWNRDRLLGLLKGQGQK